jgi:hypothetical protein
MFTDEIASWHFKNSPNVCYSYLGNPVGSWVSLVLLTKSESNLDGLEGGVGRDGVVVAVGFNGDVGLGGSNDVSLDHANI